MAVKIVTDSTADMPQDLAKALGITVVPLNVHFGEETFRDGVDINSDQFFEKLQSSPKLPTTSQPSVGAFLETYRALLDDGHDLVSIHISAKLSGTMNSATQAQEQLGVGSRLEVIDSYLAGLALSIVAVAAAKAVENGASQAEVIEVVKQASKNTRCFTLVETLEYLQRGGRIGKAAAFLGSLLHVRPVLEVRDGEIHPLERVRTRPKGIQRLYELATTNGAVERVAVCHATTPDEAADLGKWMQAFVPAEEIIQTRIGPVIGTHAGPGSMGIAVQIKE